jgi:hypothetical protein
MRRALLVGDARLAIESEHGLAGRDHGLQLRAQLLVPARRGSRLRLAARRGRHELVERGFEPGQLGEQAGAYGARIRQVRRILPQLLGSIAQLDHLLTGDHSPEDAPGAVELLPRARDHGIDAGGIAAERRATLVGAGDRGIGLRLEAIQFLGERPTLAGIGIAELALHQLEAPLQAGRAGLEQALGGRIARGDAALHRALVVLDGGCEFHAVHGRCDAGLFNDGCGGRRCLRDHRRDLHRDDGHRIPRAVDDHAHRALGQQVRGDRERRDGAERQREPRLQSRIEAHVSHPRCPAAGCAAVAL